jgi:iron complex outermembrane receptor protein
MKSFKRLLVFLTLAFSSVLLAQNVVTGTVSDENGEPLPGANVYVKEGVDGAATDVNGTFELSTDENTPFTVVVSMLGYETQEFVITKNNTNLDVALEQASFMANTVVVSASRVKESFLEAPVSVEVLDQVAIRRSPSVTLFDGLADLRELEIVANSMVFKGPTGRGFGSMNNNGLIQLIDGADNTGIANGSFSLGNMLGVSDVDVANIEFLPGASSALYGPNAYSGVLFMNTKSPFEYQGVSVIAKSGMTNSSYGGSHPFYDVQLRYGQAFGDFAFKVVGSHFQAHDWYAHDFSDRYGVGNANPAYDGINVYGDEVLTTLDFDDLAGLPAGTLGSADVARTGYREEDLFDYDPAQTTKFNAALAYRVNADLELSYSFRMGTGRSIYQGANRYGLDDILVTYHQVEAKGDNYFARIYRQNEDAGDSHDIVFSGWNVNRTWKGDEQWFTDYSTTYIGYALPVAFGGLGQTPEAAHAAARAAADVGRLMPGTAAFDEALKAVKARKDFATGSGFTSKSNFTNFEGMFNFADYIDVVDVQLGGNFRMYDVNTEGTIYSDLNDNISVDEYGAYVQVSKDILEEAIHLTGSLRLDGHKNFDDKISPRVAVVYNYNDNQHFRASFQSGFNNPTVEAQYINLNLGVIRLVGGSPDNMDRTGLQYVYDNAIDAFTGQPVTTSLLKPEFQETFEFGYKALYYEQLFVDANYFYATFEDRIKTVTVVDPSNGNVLRLYTNETGKNVILHGASLGLNYQFDSGYLLGLNYIFTERYGGDDNDPLTSLNKAKHSVKTSFGHPSVIDNLGFNIAARWRSEFTWIDNFVPEGGTVGGETIIDAQLSYMFTDYDLQARLGVNNLLGKDYRQAYGSVDIGSTYYLAFSYDLNLYR